MPSKSLLALGSLAKIRLVSMRWEHWVEDAKPEKFWAQGILNEIYSPRGIYLSISKPIPNFTICDSRNCYPQGSFAHGILQARILEWVAMPSSSGLPCPLQPQRSNPHLLCLRHWQMGSLPLATPDKFKNSIEGVKSGITEVEEWMSSKIEWYPRCVCPGVGLLGHLAVLFPVF